MIMNYLKKIYCRTFQTGLKIALPFLPYRKPKIVGSVKALPDIIQYCLANGYSIQAITPATKPVHHGIAN